MITTKNNEVKKRLAQGILRQQKQSCFTNKDSSRSKFDNSDVSSLTSRSQIQYNTSNDYSNNMKKK